MATGSTEAKKRVRTGCLTCRKKKIKCDERRPTCANCDKPGRTCIYDLMTRNHHNPTLNGSVTSLSKFYHDRPPEYSAEHLTNFVPVPLIQWTAPRTLYNFEDEPMHDPEGPYPNVNQHFVRAQQAATHGLEALSAAAADYTSHVASAYPGPYGMNAEASNSHAIDPNLEERPRAPLEGLEDYARKANPAAHEDAADEQLADALRFHTQHPGVVRASTNAKGS